MSDMYARTVTDLERRTEELQREVALKNSELRASGAQVSELKRLLDDMKSKLRLQVWWIYSILLYI